MAMMDGKVALVTGAGSGMGRTTALRMAAEGARVVAADVSGAEAQTVAEIGDGAIAVRTDVSDEDQVRTMVSAAIDAFGRLDVVCNVAGVGSAGSPLADYPADQFDRELEVNLRGVFLGMKHGIPVLLQTGGGAIVNWSSGAGLKAVPFASGYVAAKAGIVQLTQSAAQEYGGQGVRVNAICPGVIRTPLSERVMSEVPDVAEQWIAATPLGRLGEPEEVTEVALFLASDAASYVNGVAIAVDGGMHSSR
jgi:NAD(P)-dependent dehydrogenase (short-subunit alcohol dehydrogenase family)